MEWKIGEIKQVNGEWYQCIRSSYCSKCDLKNVGNCRFEFPCEILLRKDSEEVIYKKLEKVGESYKFQKRIIQTYKLYTEPFILVNMNFIWAYVKGSNTIDIIIKQDIENMEENKLNLKPFNLQKAREGKPVYTRDGRKARIICFDRRDTNNHCIVALIEDKELPNKEEVRSYFNNEKYLSNNEESVHDLMMLPEKKERWINVYKGGLLSTKYYSSKEEAVSKASQTDYIDTVKIEWKE